MQRLLFLIWRPYLNLLKRRPLIAQAMSTGVLMAGGDALSQKLVEREPSFSLNRNKNFLLVGTFFLGPCLSVWNAFINMYFVGPPVKRVLKMVLADQLIFTPPVLLGILSLLGILRGQSTTQLKEYVVAHYGGILLTNYMVWPIAQSVNFSFVPLPYRVLYINFIALFWNIYLANVTQGPKGIPDQHSLPSS
ncbi:unnamed protein product [Dicrocoelium dendriticum]|nr:unnamed protein product [Dicrocoelium dendriticum]